MTISRPTRVGAVLVLALAARPAMAAPAPEPRPAELRSAPLADLAAQADGYLLEIESAAIAIRHALARARRQGEAGRTACLNDRLNQIDATVREARSRVKELRAAITAGEPAIAEREAVALWVLRDRATTLLGEATACAK